MAKNRRNTLPRKSSPRGIQARFDARLKAHSAMRPAGKAGTNAFRKPGSRNPRKVGR